MHDFNLTTSYAPAQNDTDVRETTVGALLRDAAANAPDAPALVEVGIDGQAGRRWTYGALLADAERLASALVTAGLSLVTYNEFQGRRRLLSFDQSGPRLLGWNQIGFLALILPESSV